MITCDIAPELQIDWRTVHKVGAATDDRFLVALGEGRPRTTTLESAVLPTTYARQCAPGSRLGDPRTHSPAGPGDLLRP